LSEYRDRIGRGYEFLRENKRTLDALLSEYEMELRKNGRCPTCGGAIDPEHIREMLNEILREMSNEIRGEMGE
jgi:sugar-specific transcriptional regulator TrmB